MPEMMPAITYTADELMRLFNARLLTIFSDMEVGSEDAEDILLSTGSCAECLRMARVAGLISHATFARLIGILDATAFSMLESLKVKKEA